MWKGPSIDGVTQSLINKFLECPYSFYLYAILGLKEEEPLHPNLIWGDCYHKGLELIIPTQDYKSALEGMLDYLHVRYPQAPESYHYSLKKMLWAYNIREFDDEWVTEEVIDQTELIGDLPVRIRGKRDGIRRNHPDYGKILLEHKAKGYIDPAQTREEIGQDVQCNLYMKMEGECEWVRYDLIKIPEAQKYAPARKYKESIEKYIERLFSDSTIGSYKGNYPIFLNKANWIHQGMYHIPLETQERVWNETIAPTILRMEQWYEYVTQPDFDHTDPKWFNEIFYKHPVRHFNGRRTEKFKCNYHAYLTDQIDLTDLVPVTSYFSELEDL